VRALDVAMKALARRDFSERGLLERLERAGVEREEAERVVDRLCQVGALNEARFAANRAHALAERGKGDAAIRFDLEAQGLSHELIEPAVSRLEPERVRVERILARRGASPETARLLASRGFDADLIEAIIASSPRAALG
jgi:regulatory protein